MGALNDYRYQSFKQGQALELAEISTSSTSIAQTVFSSSGAYANPIPSDVVRDILIQNVGSVDAYYALSVFDTHGTATATTTLSALLYAGENRVHNDVLYDQVATVHTGSTASTIHVVVYPGKS